MNKFIFILFLVVIRSYEIANCSNNNLLIENDTLNKQFFDSASFKTYPSPGGGFVSGNNAYLDKVKAQEFHAGNICNIHAVIFNFGYKIFNSLNDSSYIGVNFYHLNNTGRNTLITNAPCPGTIFYRDSIKVSDIDTIAGNILIFNNALFTDSNFAIGIDFEHLNSLDTVALYTNKNGDAGTREESWEQDASGNWFTLNFNWPLNADYAIFPIVNTSVGNMQLSSQENNILVSPNPTSDGLVKLNVSTSLIKQITVYNGTLQIVNSRFNAIDLNNTALTFDTKSVGTYFILIESKDGISLKKVIVK